MHVRRQEEKEFPRCELRFLRFASIVTILYFQPSVSLQVARNTCGLDKRVVPYRTPALKHRPHDVTSSHAGAEVPYRTRFCLFPKGPKFGRFV